MKFNIGQNCISKPGLLYTSNRNRYIETIWVVGILYQIPYCIVFSSLYMGIFITYGLSLLLIFAIEYFSNKGKYFMIVSPLVLAVVVFIGLIKYIFPESGFDIDYGLIGVAIPSLVYFNKSKLEKICFLFIGLCILVLDNDIIQIFCLLSIPLLVLYNGEKGNMKLKYLFYIYYPFHLVVIWLIGLFV